jgi:hypothetical protein
MGKKTKKTKYIIEKFNKFLDKWVDYSDIIKNDNKLSDKDKRMQLNSLLRILDHAGSFAVKLYSENIEYIQSLSDKKLK